MSIQLKNLSKSYDGRQWVLKNINVNIKEGEFFAIVGPSGCGKSTLLHMIAGLTPASRGQIIINNQDVTNLPPKERHLTMVFQSYALFPYLNVEENVAFGLKINKISPTEIKKRVAQALRMNNLENLRKRKPRQLSGGQRQRVAIARAIASQQPICLMDEPLSNLDALLRVKMRGRIRRLQQKLGLTMIYVTHDQVEAMTMADRIMVINNHYIQQVGTPQDIYQHPANDFVAGFFGTPPMNLLPFNQIEKSKLIKLDQCLQINLPFALSPGKYELGLRPQALKIDLTKEITNGSVMNIEYQGANEILDVRLNSGQKMQIFHLPQAKIKAGQRIGIYPHGRYYIFDRNHKLLTEGMTNDNVKKSVKV